MSNTLIDLEGLKAFYTKILTEDLAEYARYDSLDSSNGSSSVNTVDIVCDGRVVGPLSESIGVQFTINNNTNSDIEVYLNINDVGISIFNIDGAINEDHSVVEGLRSSTPSSSFYIDMVSPNSTYVFHIETTHLASNRPLKMKNYAGVYVFRCVTSDGTEYWSELELE